MNRVDRGASLGRNAAIAAGAVAALVFLVPRLVLLFARQPFFDELFSVWIARKGSLEILAALRADSGPPLYYFLLRLLTAGQPTVLTGRLLSLLAAAGLIAAILVWKRGGEARWIAAFLLALFPPHLYFSAEARAYALCATLAGISAILFDRWSDRGERRALAAGLALALAAAYTHYYGVFFLAVPVALAALARNRRMLIDAGAGSIVAALAFVPGFLLALSQPLQAIGWMAQAPARAGPADPLLALSFAAPYPQVFVAAPPVWFQVLALAITVVSVIAGWRAVRARQWALITLVPVALAIGFGISGREVYFPMRFEAVIAAPLVLWLAFSVDAIRMRALRAALLAALVSIGLISSVMVLFYASARDLDVWRVAALFVRNNVPPSVPVVASRYGYLEILAQTSPAWDPPVVPFPREQRDHPGWARQDFSPDAAAGEVDRLPAAPFVWIGPAAGWEERALADRLRLEPLLLAGPVVVARVSEHRVDVLQDKHRGDADQKEPDDP